MMVEAPWTESWDSQDYPCVFDAEAAKRNGDYLDSVLGSEWIRKGANRRGGMHRLLSLWVTRGVSSFIRLNVLAEDLKLLDEKPGFSDVLNDLRRVNQFESALHVLHTAALFERSGLCSITEFEPKRTVRAYDFGVSTDGPVLLVEAKQVHESEKSVRFREWGEAVIKATESLNVFVAPHLPQVVVVVKDVDDIPSIHEIVAGIDLAAKRKMNARIVFRMPTFNLFLDPPPDDSEHIAEFRSVHLLCPKAKNENERVLSRVRTAEKQLRECCGSDGVGILALGLTRMQDAHDLAQIIAKGFANGRYSSVSNAMLSTPREIPGPPLGTFQDQLGFLNNPDCHNLYPGPFCFRPVAAYADILGNPGDLGGIPAYRVGCVVIKVNKIAGGFQVGFPNRVKLSREMLD